MVLGFNHNIRYRGELFHVQTEDSGRANPHIITLLYRGGTILASAKTSYADIIKVDQLEVVVESIMKEQHKEMMRRLKSGEFDARIFPGQAPSPATETQPAAPTPPLPPGEGRGEGAAPATPVATAAPVAQTAPVAAPRPAPANTVPLAAPAAAPPAAPREASAPLKPTEPPATPAKRSLDEVILDYLITGEEK